MTQDRDLERLLDTWFADGPLVVADRVIDDTAARIARQAQRPAWRPSWRFDPMNRSMLLATAGVGAIVVAAIGLALRPGPNGPATSGPSIQAGPSVQPSPKASAPAPSPTQAWTLVGPCGEQGCAGPQVPGTYTSRWLKPATTYTLGSSWVNDADWKTFFRLYPDTPANRTAAANGRGVPYVLVLPGEAEVSPSRGCVDKATDFIKVDASGLAEHLARQKLLTLTDPVAVRIGGLPGIQIDVSPKFGWTGCLPGEPIGEVLAAGDQHRFIVLDRPDRSAIFIRLRLPAPAAASDWPAYLAIAMPVVQSFRFDGLP